MDPQAGATGAGGRFPWIGQVVRYGIVGVVSNAVLYLLYLLLTGRGLGPKTAMTILYAVGVLQTFLANRGWTFGHRGRLAVSLARYVLCYAVGYLFNWVMLYSLVDRLGWPHRPTQAALILCTAAILFVLQRLWVFREAGQGGGQG